MNRLHGLHVSMDCRKRFGWGVWAVGGGREGEGPMLTKKGGWGVRGGG